MPPRQSRDRAQFILTLRVTDVRQHNCVAWLLVFMEHHFPDCHLSTYLGLPCDCPQQTGLLYEAIVHYLTVNSRSTIKSMNCGFFARIFLTPVTLQNLIG
jgi:hypothetical protein